MEGLGDILHGKTELLKLDCFCSYGTGAIMAVPAHDTRDHEFALKYDIPIRWVVAPDDESLSESGKAFSGQGIVINSSSSTFGLDINGLCSKEAVPKVIEWAEKTGNGRKKVPLSVYWKLKDSAMGVFSFFLSCRGFRGVLYLLCR